MYEARQHKEKVSRVIGRMENKNIQKNTIKDKVSPMIIQCNTKDDPFVYGYTFRQKHLSAQTGDGLKNESLRNMNLTLINENSLTRQLNNGNFNFMDNTYGRWNFEVTVRGMEAYYSSHLTGANLLDKVKLKGYFLNNSENLITHLEY